MKLRASAMAQHVNGYVSLTKKRGKGPLFFKNQDATKNPSILNDGMPVQASDSSALYASLESSNYQESSFEQNQLWQPLKQRRVGRFINCVTANASENIIRAVNFADGKVYNAEKQLDFQTLLAFDMNDHFCPALPIALLPPEKDEKIDEIFYSKQLFTDEDLNMWLSTIPGMNIASNIFSCILEPQARVCQHFLLVHIIILAYSPFINLFFFSELADNVDDDDNDNTFA